MSDSATLPSPGTAQRQRLRIRGLVQGVGFRPHVYRCATRLGINGFVLNDGQGVLVEAEGLRLAEFLAELRRQAPPLARIDSIVASPIAIPDDRGAGFSILPSRSGTASGAAIPADVAICRSCLEELFTPSDRRYLHPFIACCDCGPRFTMARSLPYDRSTTSMSDFQLCLACNAEYRDPASRRFHAEPIACHDCGPHLDGSPAGAADTVAAGGIVALKGIGGYHLACDARNSDAVRRLRARKRRDGKPFAAMLLNPASARRHLHLDRTAAALLESAERPVVVAPARANSGLSPELAPGLGTLGAVLPYTAAHYLLFYHMLGRPRGSAWLDEDCPVALVMTSANLSGDPLICTAAEAGEQLADIADCFVHHDREIVSRVDDSVVRATRTGGLLVRRARGYAPHALGLSAAGPRVLALGAHLKSTLTMTRGDQAYLSQHVGDLDTPAAVALHAQTASQLQATLGCTPQRLACDLNPDFASSRLAQRLCSQWQVPLVPVQHHHAHIAAVMAEHKLEGEVLGVALDGHGQGEHGASWGGELLQVAGADYTRKGHFAPMALPGGDTAARQPWRMAAAALHALGRGDEIAHRFPDQATAPALEQWLASANDMPVTTAAGRLFDTAAGLLGICEVAAFEAQAPMLLEALAHRPRALANGYRIESGVLDFRPLLAALADCREPAIGAQWLHSTLIEGIADWVERCAEASGISRIVLSGGCMLNGQLADRLPRKLRGRNLQVFQARALPPNDGAISLGQAWVAQRHYSP